MPTQTRIKAKGRKVGRNARFCESYFKSGTRMKNKLRKIRRHIKRFPEDKRAVSALKRLAG